MSNAWTPGPWFIVTPTHGFDVCTIYGVERQPTEDGLGQTWVYIRPKSLVRDGEWHWPDEAECTANAHLIAAAPDMYAALLVAELASEELCQGQDPANECWVTLATIRAALAKARGEAE